MFWTKTETDARKEANVKLEDVIPQHPEAYPARNLRARLKALRLKLAIPEYRFADAH